jgi:hypothetical protein
MRGTRRRTHSQQRIRTAHTGCRSPRSRTPTGSAGRGCTFPTARPFVTMRARQGCGTFWPSPGNSSGHRKCASLRGRPPAHPLPGAAHRPMRRQSGPGKLWAAGTGRSRACRLWRGGFGPGHDQHRRRDRFIRSVAQQPSRARTWSRRRDRYSRPRAMLAQPMSRSRLIAMLRALARNCGDAPVRTWDLSSSKVQSRT